MAPLRAAIWAVVLVAAGCVGKIDPGVGGGTASGGSGTPGGTGNAPGGTGNAPGGTGNTPGGTGAATGSGGTGTPGSGGAGTPGSGGAGPVVTTPPSNPGNVVARRLNQIEYNNTVRDLLGTALRPASDFPADDLGAEFDTVGSALSLSPAYVTAYEKAAYAVVDELLASTDAARKQKVVSCNVDTAGDTCAKTILTAFARKAWRRPVTAEEATGLMLPVTTAKTVGAKPADGLRYGLAAVLMSPFFIFKLEVDPDPTSLTPRRLNGHELATRLSYGLWSTMPDDMLFAAADAGKLATDPDVTAQIDRMLADARSDALLDGFAGEWLDFKDLDAHEVEAAKFPTFKAALRTSMKAEARRFIREFLRSEIPVSQVLNGRFTFVDTTLATHYGLTRTGGGAATDLVRVDTTSAPRAGLLTLGAFLMTTSLSSRTSPVKRGQFVFERLMCGVVPAPPPGIPSFPENMPGLTGRQLAELHRADPSCNGCHALMDPLGFGLENYDAIGAYRTKDGTGTIDATGMMPDGTKFNGGVELADALAKDPRFVRCATSKFMTYALGRLMNQKDDSTWIDYVTTRVNAAAVPSLPGIVRSVILSDAFRARVPAPAM